MYKNDTDIFFAAFRRAMRGEKHTAGKFRTKSV